MESGATFHLALPLYRQGLAMIDPERDPQFAAAGQQGLISSLLGIGHYYEASRLLLQSDLRERLSDIHTCVGWRRSFWPALARRPRLKTHSSRRGASFWSLDASTPPLICSWHYFLSYFGRENTKRQEKTRTKPAALFESLDMATVQPRPDSICNEYRSGGGSLGRIRGREAPGELERPSDCQSRGAENGAHGDPSMTTWMTPAPGRISYTS